MLAWCISTHLSCGYFDVKVNMLSVILTFILNIFNIFYDEYQCG